MQSVGKIIATYRKKAKYTQPMLSDKLAEYGIKVSHRTISGWEQGISEPNIKTFLCICLILGIPDCVEEMYDINPSNPMSQLNKEGKERVTAFIDTLVRPTSFVKDSITAPQAFGDVRTIRLYSSQAFSEDGSFMNSNLYSLLPVQKEAYADADFAVTIHDDSMAPAFCDHYVAYIHRQETLKSGEFGFFSLNGDTCIKQFQKNENGISLLSLNKDYAPIPVHPEQDSFHILGRVCDE